MIPGGGDFAPPEYLAIPGDIFGCHTVTEMLLRPSAWEPGVLPNIPKCIGWPLMTKNDLAPNVHSATAGKPSSKGL